MTCSRLLVPAALAATLAVPAAADALPSSSRADVSVRPAGPGAVLVRFKRAALREVAGQRVTITCTKAAPRPPGVPQPVPGVTRVRVPRRISALRVHASAGSDLCSLSTRHDETVAIIALGLDARALLAEVQTSGLIELVAGAASSRTGFRPYRALPPVARRVSVPLAAADAAPPKGRAGYFRAGAHDATVTALADTGRRLFLSERGDTVTTNLLALNGRLEALSSDPRADAVPFPGLPRPAPLPAPQPGVSATRARGEIVVRFDRSRAAQAALRGLRGGRASVVCTGAGGLNAGSSGGDIAVPRRASTVRIPFDGRFAYCVLRGRGAPLAVAVTPAGRTRLLEARTAQLVLAALDRAERLAYPRTLSGTTALASRDATPPAGQIGYWSDGAAHAAAVAVAPTGRRLFYEVDGDVTRSNLLDALP